METILLIFPKFVNHKDNIIFHEKNIPVAGASRTIGYFL